MWPNRPRICVSHNETAGDLPAVVRTRLGHFGHWPETRGNALRPFLSQGGIERSSLFSVYPKDRRNWRWFDSRCYVFNAYRISTAKGLERTMGWKGTMVVCPPVVTVQKTAIRSCVFTQAPSTGCSTLLWMNATRRKKGYGTASERMARSAPPDLPALKNRTTRSLP